MNLFKIFNQYSLSSPCGPGFAQGSEAKEVNKVDPALLWRSYMLRKSKQAHTIDAADKYIEIKTG